jgi:hypothetical protein
MLLLRSGLLWAMLIEPKIEMKGGERERERKLRIKGNGVKWRSKPKSWGTSLEVHFLVNVLTVTQG